jgi:ribonuclease J
MKLTIHRGTHEIGGSIVEIATRGSRLVIDVGLPLGGLNAPAANPLATDKTLTRVFARSPLPSAILLSHAHGDHSGLLAQTPKAVPVFLSRGTAKMMRAGALFARQPDVPSQRQHLLAPLTPIVIGDFAVTGFPVDHSAFGSMAFLVEADGQRLLYSGDLRCHGRKPGMAQQLIRTLRHRSLDALVMEGTHFSPERAPGLTEAALERRIRATIARAPALVLAAFSPLHADRLVTFFKATRDAGRVLVLDVYGAQVMLELSHMMRVPDPCQCRQVRVYFPKRRRRLAAIEKQFAACRITLEEIRAAPHRFVMLFRPSMLGPDFGGELPEKTCGLYSYWSGYLKKPDWLEAQAQFAKAGGEFIQCHTSGHIHAADIVSFVNALSPRFVIPIHTEKPAEFSRHFANSLLLQDGQAVDVGN